MAENMNAIYWEVYRKSISDKQRNKETAVNCEGNAITDEESSLQDNNERVLAENSSMEGMSCQTNIKMEVGENANEQPAVDDPDASNNKQNIVNDDTHNADTDNIQDDINYDNVMNSKSPSQSQSPSDLREDKIHSDIIINNDDSINENAANHHHEQICGDDGMWRPW